LFAEGIYEALEKLSVDETAEQHGVGLSLGTSR
jgi:hypothetical protein